MAHAPIQQLPPGLINRIAAGEVIERPASVVKELVENAIDAGASRIVVEIEDGGRQLIRVIDDGGGIPADELPLAFASHATSKLATDDDLFRIATMGFRGEALASIGAVSHARILSRTSESQAAYDLENVGGRVGQPQASAGNIGTVVEVRNLFFNTPARRKFLKGPATEFGHIGETLTRLAVAFNEVAFELFHNGRRALSLAAAPPRDRWLAAWPGEFAELALDLSARDAEMTLTGIVGLPELARPVAKHQYVYLNGRAIRDRTVQHALREAYRGLTEPGRHPAAVLLLEMPPGDVDVNVHPTKTEVRFRDSGRIHGLILSAVREKLLGSDLAPAAMPMSAPHRPMPDEQRQDLREKLAAFFRTSIPGAAPGAMEADLSAEPATLPNLAPPPSAPPSPWELRSPAPVQSTLQPTLSPAAPPAAANVPSPLPAGALPPASPAATISAAMSAGAAIQLHNSYLVAESPDGLVIIDQHALHERILFEDLLARVSRGPLESQRLLLPLTLPATARQQELLAQISDLLRRLGIEAEPFGPDAVAIHAFPSFLHRLDPLQFVHDLLERGEQELFDLHQEELLHEVLDMMACKAAVKAGDPLSGAEIDALLAGRHLIDRSSNCPHGRPTTLRLTLRDLEKQFKRTGF